MYPKTNLIRISVTNDLLTQWFTQHDGRLCIDGLQTAEWDFLAIGQRDKGTTDFFLAKRGIKHRHKDKDIDTLYQDAEQIQPVYQLVTPGDIERKFVCPICDVGHKTKEAAIDCCAGE